MWSSVRLLAATALVSHALGAWPVKPYLTVYFFYEWNKKRTLMGVAL